MPRIGQQSYWLKRWIKNTNTGAALPAARKCRGYSRKAADQGSATGGEHTNAVAPPLAWSAYGGGLGRPSGSPLLINNNE